ncbi:hypothetical protein ACGFYP_08955 [Streptomyces sp. NPDC048370]|uniref:hypothetical protein n=1 Tax=Streptomyces sp. NPDC048370 TaxID=3365540 RepID=UPI00371C6B6C
MHDTVDNQYIVALLVRGWSDERISRTLALSKRTVQRRVRQLMQEYGCTSRFALGFALGLQAVPRRAAGRETATPAPVGPVGRFT